MDQRYWKRKSKSYGRIVSSAMIVVGAGGFLLLKEQQPLAVTTPSYREPASPEGTKQSAPLKQAASLRHVQHAIKKRNDDNLREKQRFQEAGWRFVEAPAPDPAVMALDPSVLPAKEAEVQQRLQTNTFKGEMLSKVARIALATRDDQTKFVAIDCLGRSTDPTAQNHLMDLYGALTASEDRQQILQLMKPQSLSDDVSAFLVKEMNGENRPLALRRQAAFALAARALSSEDLSYEQLPQDFLSKIAPGFREEFRTAYEKLRNPGGGH